MEAAQPKIIVMSEQGFIPQQMAFKKGAQVELIVHNQGKLARRFVIPGFAVTSPFLMEGEMASIRFIPNQTGSFPIQGATSHTAEDPLIGSFVITE
ncbi:hypothetical protein BEP19_14100 [Ammoniphilus oxalaticus]|uniref:EfeO-type cupredoxin-like domain-containing protein n=2 Tax=Ammoniphilus oxalaticus TaxID=66863 RepID=A0A419SEK5_9BACL|nr:hypothetical protein BEP19_14100 [Ammoniphilus oxalaticus]